MEKNKKWMKKGKFKNMFHAEQNEKNNDFNNTNIYYIKLHLWNNEKTLEKEKGISMKKVRVDYKNSFHGKGLPFERWTRPEDNLQLHVQLCSAAFHLEMFYVVSKMGCIKGDKITYQTDLKHTKRLLIQYYIYLRQ